MSETQIPFEKDKQKKCEAIAVEWVAAVYAAAGCVLDDWGAH